jgi:NADH pyrophosphatase NudC (nudix superfamily)
VYEAFLLTNQEIVPDGTEVEEARWIAETELAGLSMHGECVKAIHTYLNLKR